MTTKFNSKCNLLKIIPIIAIFCVGGLQAAAKEKVIRADNVNAVEIAEVDIENANDPLESVNRLIFEFNEFVQALFLRPIAELYNENLPLVFRSGVSNFLDNISTPITVANQLLQGDPDAAMRSIGRFVVNSTAGIGGIADVASELAGQGRTEDFGQTMGKWGIGEGFYLVLPVFGPSSPRDAIGKFMVDSYFDPVGLWISNTDQSKLYWSEKVVDGVSEYSGVVDELEQMRKTSIDYYAVIRSLYRQKRASEIKNGEIIDIPTIPDLSYDLEPVRKNHPLAGVSSTSN